ncbi:MAG: molybdopterin biosynthesis protein [Ruminiclostridium sp.]|nr:molybdopterin biosynthesis protein [Ruminiclostridium sp.]
MSNMELEEALRKYIDRIKNSISAADAEEIPVRNSLGRITSEAVYASISSPHYNACAMDGIAVYAKKTFGATETTPVTLKEGEDFVRVDTGDLLPGGFDAVIMIEDVIDAGDMAINLLSPATPWQHIRQIGEDICAGEMILTSNTGIEPAAIGAMLAGGVLKVKVHKRPVVGIIPTGDEVVAPAESPREGEIIEFNTSIFSAMLEEWGASARIYSIVPDDCQLIREAVLRASGECDAVILNAGSSAGRDDYSVKAIREVGKVLVHGIAIRPGKPTILGMVGNKPVIGVPGYPVSGIIVMEKLVKPVIEVLAAVGIPLRNKADAILTRKLVSSLKYKEYIRVKLGNVDGRLTATPLNRGAGVITSFVKADAILEVPLNTEGYEAGSAVEVELLKSLKDINNTLVITGSHDPLIDITADIMRRNYSGIYISSSHIGSMGGIMAVKRGEAHAAGIHLLDEATGLYNTGFIKKYFPDGEIAVLTCVKRIQGFMVAPGNPWKIKGLNDIFQSGVKYVNRQKGSGTRILLDYLLRKDVYNPQSLYGYEREEFTHMSVAALVASGSADAGLGIYSAARAFRLDFIPLCQEQYDFIMPSRFLELGASKRFIEILKADEFRNALEMIGGYDTEDLGKVVIA